MPLGYGNTKLPDEGHRLKRLSADKVGVYKITVELVAEIKVIQIPGRKIYETADGEVWSDCKDAAEHVLGGGDATGTT